jgi:hypothetical protein
MKLIRFKNNLRFALHKELSEQRISFPPNQSERIGNLLSWFAYEFRSIATKFICDPRCLTIYFTFLAMIFASFVFYPSITFDILTRVAASILDHINWGYFRFGLWILSEITILGIGFRAFGRFSNPKLMESHGLVS